MKPIRAISLLLLLLSLACTPSSSDVHHSSAAVTNPQDVYVIGGQSNAEGTAKVADLSSGNAWLADPYTMQHALEIDCPRDGTGNPCGYSGVWFDEVEPHGFASQTGIYLGIELTAGRRLIERFGADCALLKSATSSSSLDKHWDSTAGGYVGLDTYMHDYIDIRLPELPSGSEVKGVFWLQGETDAKTLAAAEDYSENMLWFINRFRRAYGDVPFVIAKAHEDLNPTKYFYLSTVRAEQDLLVANTDDVYLVNADDLALRSDLAHYTSDSFVTLGTRMANALP